MYQVGVPSIPACDSLDIGRPPFPNEDAHSPRRSGVAVVALVEIRNTQNEKKTNYPTMLLRFTHGQQQLLTSNHGPRN